MLSWSTVFERLRHDPVGLLGRKDAGLILPWLLGYESAAEAAGIELGNWDREGRLQAWAERHYGFTKEEGCRQNAVGFAMLVSVDEAAAFDRFMDDARAAGVPENREFPCTATKADKPGPRLLALLSLIRQRPGMYLGNGDDQHLTALRAMVNGYGAAETDFGMVHPQARLFDDFQQWLAERYPFAAGQPWDRTLMFLSLGHGKGAWKSFFEIFEMWMRDLAPGALSPVAEALAGNLIKAMSAEGPLTDEEKRAVRERARRLAP
jgi:hypothetical protein